MLAAGTVCCRLRQSLVLTALTAALLLSPRLLLSQVGGLASLLVTLRLIFLPVPTTLCSNKPSPAISRRVSESPRQFPPSSSSSLLVLSACRMGDWRLQQEHQCKCCPSHAGKDYAPSHPQGTLVACVLPRRETVLLGCPFHSQQGPWRGPQGMNQSSTEQTN